MIPGTTLGTAVVRALAAGGVTRVFGIPGTHTLGLYRALDAARVDHVTARHEQGAGFMADGATRSTGQVAACSVICGPGIANVATAVGQAYSDAVPILVLAGDLSRAERGGRGGHAHELRDQDALLRAVTDRVTRACEPEDVLHAVRDALAPRRWGRPAPAVVQVPQDLWDAPVDPDRTGPTASERRPAPADAGIVDETVALLTDARRPVVVAGGGAAGAADDLRRLAERLDAPVLTTLNGKGTIDARHRLHAGIVTQQYGVPQGAAEDLLTGADVVLAVGTELGPTDFWATRPRLTGRLVHIDVDPVAIGRHLPADIALTADVATVLAELADRLPVADRSGAASADTCRRRLDAEAAALGAPYASWIAALRHAMPDDACLAVDSTGANYYGATPLFPVHGPRGWLNPSGLGTLGYAVPAAIGAAVATPGRPTVALVGDGGLMFTMPELLVAAEREIPLVTVVWRNGGFGEIARLLDEQGAGPVGCQQRAPDYPALAAALGCRYAEPHDPADLAAAVAGGLDADGPTLVVVP
ncbi:acetolactate synthase [Verrucosispora sp. SN26_14.1]|uniref:thiamine pyrophosphate-binding protein n=1 Tax=Verrucosispora sp. SN26_14.1 TaxID=2527879 RepID=UPI001033332A|nr:thiamine pyrophosphate-binding protein [Verrucosispora sp. SN26_14.1]TBL29527.1 acetolactate synthase [Verrucosispora sp. SN26_14.1]